jgi:nucleotide-binding universal stress UspA family protein
MSSNGPAPAVAGRIVVGVDGSESSKQALRWARYLARMAGDTLEVVMVWKPFGDYGAVGAGWVGMPSDWDPARDTEKALIATVDEVFGADRPAGLKISVVEGSPAWALIEAGKDARMLVVGSRGHGGFAGLLLGSVSATCVEHARCPVLVLHGDTPPPS